MDRKTLKYLLLLCSLLAGFSAQADMEGDTIRLTPVVKQKKPYPFQPLVLETSPTGILFGGVFPVTSEYRFTAEMTSGRKQSEQVSISYLSKNIFYALFEGATKVANQRTLKCTGYRLQYAHKFYLVNRRHHSPYGFYVGPHVSYTNARVSLGLTRYYRNSYYDFRHFNANFIFGVQMGKASRLTVDICGGIGYKNNELYYHATTFRVSKLDSEDFGLYYNNHIHLLFDVSMGYSF